MPPPRAIHSGLIQARSREPQRRLVSDASHEMRTPLTSLRSNVELLRRIEQLPEPERQDVVDDVVLDIDDLADLARSAAAGTDRRTQRNIPVTENSPSGVVGNGRQLERAIGNLVDNAVKYSPGSTALP